MSLHQEFAMLKEYASGIGKKKEVYPKGRLPKGQFLTKIFPTLDLGTQPDIDMNKWKLKISGLVKKPLELSLEDLKKLGTKNYSEDFHCVTKWSKFDVKWTGIPIKEIIKFSKPNKEWKFLIQYGKDGYSTNVPREDVEKENVFLAFELEGKPIPREHGYVRLIIPHLYGWKTSKFLKEIEFSEIDKPGYWETRGYNNHGDVSKEERYS
jgi:DMSO/TMAO reductase YedYZ molybdopterin-dependent catalytic subunit